MKKLIALLSAFVLVLVFVGCNTKNSEEHKPGNQPSLIGVIEEIYENHIMICGEQIEGYPKGEIFQVSLNTEEKITVDDFDIGDRVIVYFNGEVAESDPLQINTVYSIVLDTSD